MIDLTADLDIFFADLGTTALVGAVTIPALFDVPFKAAGMYEGQVETTAPACTVKSADVAAQNIDHGTVITIGGNGYQVIGVEPDGAGLTRLILTNQY